MHNSDIRFENGNRNTVCQKRNLSFPPGSSRLYRNTVQNNYSAKECRIGGIYISAKQESSELSRHVEWTSTTLVCEFPDATHWFCTFTGKFSKVIFDLLIEKIHAIYRWIAMEIMKLFHFHRFSKLVTVFKEFQIYYHYFRDSTVFWSLFSNHSLDWCIWYAVGKLWKSRNFVISRIFSKFLTV